MADAVHIASPSGQRDFLCDDAGASAVREFYRRERNVASLREQGIPAIVLDFGGACLANEPQEEVRAAGLRFLVPVTQFATAMDILRSLELGRALPGCVFVKNWVNCNYVLSGATRDALVAEMSRLWPSVEPRSRAAREAFDRAFLGGAE